MGNYDEETKDEIRKLMKYNPKELEESFYKNLEFGTGGLRGIMGVGTNRMNLYTVGMATQGLANYMKASFGNKQLSVAIAFDCRNNSRLFAKTTANVFAANGFKVFLFNELRPTPELSFAIRYLNCDGGVMITASHNPKEYNGYKAYWNDGAQITAPHDSNIIREVLKVQEPSQVQFSGGEQNIHMLDNEMDDAYLKAILSLTLSPDLVKKNKDLTIVFTPLHGTGVKIVPEALTKIGFDNIIHIREQDVTDGNFPTVASPNPEEPSALQMALEKADEVSADLVMATDPDADRLGVAVRDINGKMVLLNGNQTASLLTYYILSRWQELGKLKQRNENDHFYMVKTIVTSDLLKSIADKFGVEMFNVLTGFKYIEEVVKKLEGKREFIAGGEESYGFNAGEFVRDKDAVISSCLVAEAAAWAAEKGKTLYEMLVDIYVEFGFYKERLLSLTKKGKDGVAEIQSMMKYFRSEPIRELAGSRVIFVHDYKYSETTDLRSGIKSKIDLPESDVIQFVSEDQSVVSVRPSGTEPKIKFYFGVKGELDCRENFHKVNVELDIKLDKLSGQMSSL